MKSNALLYYAANVLCVTYEVVVWRAVPVDLVRGGVGVQHLVLGQHEETAIWVKSCPQKLGEELAEQAATVNTRLVQAD